MSNKKLQKIYPLLKLTTKLNPEESGDLMNHLSDSTCNQLIACVRNALYNQKLGKKARNSLKIKLNDHKDQIRKLAAVKGGGNARNQLSQSGGFISALIAAILPLITTLLFKK